MPTKSSAIGLSDAELKLLQEQLKAEYGQDVSLEEIKKFHVEIKKIERIHAAQRLRPEEEEFFNLGFEFLRRNTAYQAACQTAVSVSDSSECLRREEELKRDFVQTAKANGKYTLDLYLQETQRIEFRAMMEFAEPHLNDEETELLRLYYWYIKDISRPDARDLFLSHIAKLLRIREVRQILAETRSEAKGESITNFTDRYERPGGIRLLEDEFEPTYTDERIKALQVDFGLPRSILQARFSELLNEHAIDARGSVEVKIFSAENTAFYAALGIISDFWGWTPPSVNPHVNLEDLKDRLEAFDWIEAGNIFADLVRHRKGGIKRDDPLFESADKKARRDYDRAKRIISNLRTGIFPGRQ